MTLVNINHAGLAWYNISGNGKVDIYFEKEGKISLEPSGMFKLVKDWIKDTNDHEISKAERDELIKLLKPKATSWEGYK
ncbi:hypothetical protein [Anaerospora hongkongensis]|uniref:hypothetical protein n=1 Tax=Anaerospora hongkongensis TaxID=244830 RepID=UPI00289CC507|nr:hypothetical protein [Anaerospora hongkongensis]